MRGEKIRPLLLQCWWNLIIATAQNLFLTAKKVAFTETLILLTSFLSEGKKKSMLFIIQFLSSTNFKLKTKNDFKSTRRRRSASSLVQRHVILLRAERGGVSGPGRGVRSCTTVWPVQGVIQREERPTAQQLYTLLKPNTLAGLSFQPVKAMINAAKGPFLKYNIMTSLCCDDV